MRISLKIPTFCFCNSWILKIEWQNVKAFSTHNLTCLLLIVSTYLSLFNLFACTQLLSNFLRQKKNQHLSQMQFHSSPMMSNFKAIKKFHYLRQDNIIVTEVSSVYGQQLHVHVHLLLVMLLNIITQLDLIKICQVGNVQCLCYDEN